MSDIALFKGLTEEQITAVTDQSPIVCIIAGPGSGKTTVLTKRIAHRATKHQIAPKNTVVITFTNQAAQELRTRLATFNLYDLPWIGTFHAFAFQVIRKYHEERRTHPPLLITSKPREIQAMLHDSRDLKGLISRSPSSSSETSKLSHLVIAEIATEIENAKSEMILVNDYLEWYRKTNRQSSIGGDVLAEIFMAYEARKKKLNRIDFEDLLLVGGDILVDNTSFAATFRWWYRHFYVDEFQDVNRPQIRLLKGLVGDNPDLCVVGDPKQAIYTWNGATPGILLNFDQTFPRAQYRYLTANFRSSPEIVDLANAIATSFEDSDLSRRGGVIYAKRQGGSMPKLLEFENDENESKEIAKSIYESITDGRLANEIAVIARTNSLLPPLAEALSSLRVPHQILGGEQILNNNLVKSTMKHLKEVLGPRGRLQDAIVEIDNLIKEFENDRNSQKTEESLEYLRSIALESLRFDPRMDIYGFTTYFKARANDIGSTKKDGVTLTTLHRSKGLEWPSVYLIALENGILPHSKSVTPSAYEEEKRLLYVGITRARDNLILSYAKKRGSSNKFRSPSDLLYPIEELVTMGNQKLATKEVALSYIRQNRKMLLEPHKSSLPQGIDPIIDTLLLWRKTKALAEAKEDRSILSEVTLEAIAASLPRGIDELNRIPGVSTHFSITYGRELLRLTNGLRKASKSRT